MRLSSITSGRSNDHSMARFLVFAFLLVCLFHVFQANPMPQDTQQPATNNLDSFAEQVKKAWNNATDTIHEKLGQFVNEMNLNDAIDKTRSILNQAGENIRKEAEKIGEKLRD